MAVSLTSMSMQKANPIDKNAFKSGGSSGSLDVVAGAGKGGGGSQQNSLSKIAKFKPSQLRDFSSKIDSSIAKNKQSSQIREAKNSLVKEKVQSIRSQNPFTNKGLAESHTGGKVNILS